MHKLHIPLLTMGGMLSKTGSTKAGFCPMPYCIDRHIVEAAIKDVGAQWSAGPIDPSDPNRSWLLLNCSPAIFGIAGPCQGLENDWAEWSLWWRNSSGTSWPIGKIPMRHTLLADWQYALDPRWTTVMALADRVVAAHVTEHVQGVGGPPMVWCPFKTLVFSKPPLHLMMPPCFQALRLSSGWTPSRRLWCWGPDYQRTVPIARSRHDQLVIKRHAKEALMRIPGLIPPYPPS